MDQGKELKSPKVSVIIPVYNTDAYLEEAVRSIMNQTLKELEIIIIDDGSTDNSLTIIKKLAQEDNRIKWISQPNMGLSVARNIGIENAGGEYLYFMDSDDFLEADALMSCLQTADQNDVDFLLFNAEILKDDNNFDVPIDYQKPELSDKEHYSGRSIISEMLTQRTYRCSPCIHFIRLKTVQSLSLRFFPGIIHEDELFSGLLYLQSQRVVYLPRTYFKRRLRPNSVMTSKYSMKNVGSYLIVGEQLLLFAKSQDAENQFLTHRLISYILDPNIYRANNLTFSERLSVFRKSIDKKLIKFISKKSLIVLLFPFTIELKRILTHKTRQ